jgi:hypothetical protein
MVLWTHFSGQIHPEKVIEKFLKEVFMSGDTERTKKSKKRGKDQ